MTANVVSKASLFMITVSIILLLQVKLGQACLCLKTKKYNSIKIIKNDQPIIISNQHNENCNDAELDTNEIIVDLMEEKDEVKNEYKQPLKPTYLNDLTKENVKQIKKDTKYSKVKTHLHRNILQYLDVNSPATYRYLRNMIQWNPQGFFAGDFRPPLTEDENHTDKDLSLSQRFTLHDLFYNCSKICAPDQNRIRSKYTPRWREEISLMTYNHRNSIQKYPKSIYKAFTGKSQKYPDDEPELFSFYDILMLSEEELIEINKKVLTQHKDEDEDMRTIDFSSILSPFSIIFFTIGESSGAKSILQLKLIDIRADWLGRGEHYQIQFQIKIHERRVKIRFVFSQRGICEKIEIHTWHMSPDKLEKMDLFFEYERDPNFYPNKKHTSYIAIFHFKTFKKLFQQSKEEFSDSEDDIKTIGNDFKTFSNDDYDLFKKQLLYVQFF